MRASMPDEQRRAMGDLQLEARQLADAQRQVASELGRTSEGEAANDTLRRLASDEERLAERVQRLQDNLERLSRMTDQDGRPLRIETLPMPPPLYHEEQRLPASYANFYSGNRVILTPGYDPERDAAACATLQRLFTDRRGAVIASADLVWGLGAFHCVTQQWPAVNSQP